MQENFKKFKEIFGTYQTELGLWFQITNEYV